MPSSWREGLQAAFGRCATCEGVLGLSAGGLALVWGYGGGNAAARSAAGGIHKALGRAQQTVQRMGLWRAGSPRAALIAADRALTGSLEQLEPPGDLRRVGHCRTLLLRAQNGELGRCSCSHERSPAIEAIEAGAGCARRLGRLPAQAPNPWPTLRSGSPAPPSSAHVYVLTCRATVGGAPT